MRQGEKTGDLFHLHARRHRLLAGSVPQARGDPPLHPTDASDLEDAQVGKRKIKLSNLEKVLCPEDGVLKVACQGTERQATH